LPGKHHKRGRSKEKKIPSKKKKLKISGPFSPGQHGETGNGASPWVHTKVKRKTASLKGKLSRGRGGKGESWGGHYSKRKKKKVGIIYGGKKLESRDRFSTP